MKTNFAANLKDIKRVGSIPAGLVFGCNDIGRGIDETTGETVFFVWGTNWTKRQATIRGKGLRCGVAMIGKVFDPNERMNFSPIIPTDAAKKLISIM